MDTELQYRRLFETASDGIVLLEKNEGKITHANPATEKMLGYNQKESIGRKLPDIGVSLDMDDFQTTMQNLNKSGIINYRNLTVETKSGQHIDTEVYLVDRAKLVQCNIRDITERIVAKNDLQESEDRYRSLFENSMDAILLTATDGRILAANPEACLIFGRSEEDICQIGRAGLVDQRDPRLKTALEEWKRTGRFRGELNFLRENGAHFLGEISSSIYNDRGGKQMTSMNIRDITKRKQTEEALRESEEKNRWILDNMADVITVMDMNLRFTYVSPSIIRMRGYTAEEAVAQTLEQVMTPESLQISAKVFEEEMKLEASGTADPDRIRIVEVEQYKKDGSIVLMENHLSFMRDEAKKPVGIISVSHDITERRRAEEALLTNRAQLANALEMARLGHWEYDVVNDLFTFNDQFYGMFHTTAEQVGGYTMCSSEYARRFVHPDDIEVVGEETRKAIETTDPHFTQQIEHRMLYADGTVGYITVRFFIIKDSHGRTVKTYGVNQDITERKRAEEALNKAKTLLDKTFASMDEAILIVDSNTRKIIACNHATEIIFGFVEKDLVGYSTDVLHVDKLSYDLFGQELFPVLDANGVFRTEFQMRRKNGSVFHTENTVTEILDDLGYRNSVVSVVRDITDRKQAEKQLQDTLESLRKAVATTIQVMVSAVEARDPYTAGHQLRIADLARAIATEMGLSLEKIDGIRMAGSIHDIGKLSIPAEILSKPTKLSEIEFALVKEHAQKGFEILKDVESPWPLAEIVYQHHERMDGSGYPRKLKGDEILIEARIMAVADVVEAMSSHRPYRPGKGMDAALEEIEKNRGILYDDAVVNACLSLFREKGFQLEGT
ncbi:MAG: PAS domain S-box protein [Syntrophales bacterium]